MKDFIDILKKMGLYSEKGHNKTNHTFKINNCTYEFFSVDDASKLRGARRDILFLNEANNITHDAFTQLYMRTKQFAFLDYNPSHLGWIRDYIEEDNFVKLTYKDNEFLPQSTIEFYKDAERKAKEGSTYWKNFVKVFVYGEEGIAEGLIFENWNEGEEVPEDAKYLGAALDWGFSNDPSVIVKIYRYDGKIYLKESLYSTGLLNSHIANHINRDPELSRGIIICDSSEPKSIAELKSYGINVLPVKKYHGSIVSGIGIMQEYELVVVGANLIKEFSNYCYAKNKQGETLNVPIDKYNHGIDAIRYFFMMKLGKSTVGVNTLTVSGSFQTV